jgi:succinate dehydrogenase / fumarate reductase, cytochrome b subunit
MESTKKRPIFLNLLTIRLPIGAVVSIAHRITGVLLVLLLPLAVYLLQLSLESPAAFDRTLSLVDSAPGRLTVLLLVWVFAQHFFAGIRHLLLDIDIGVELKIARRSAWLTLAGSAIIVVLVGIGLA